MIPTDGFPALSIYADGIQEVVSDGSLLRRRTAGFGRFFLQDLLDQRMHGRDVLFGRFPQHLIIHSEVLMNQLIPHPGHLFPRNLLMPLPHNQRDLLPRFTDNLEGSDHCI